MMNLKKIISTLFLTSAITFTGVTPVTTIHAQQKEKVQQEEIRLENEIEPNLEELVAEKGYDFNNQYITNETAEYILNSTVEVVAEVVYKSRMIDLPAIIEALDTNNFNAEELQITLPNRKTYRAGSGVVVSKDMNQLEILTAEHLKRDIEIMLVKPSPIGGFLTVYTLHEVNYYLVKNAQEDFRGMPIITEDNSIKLNYVKEDPSDLMLLRSGELSEEELSNYSIADLIAEETELVQGNIVYVAGYPTYLGKQLTVGYLSGGITPNPRFPHLLQITAPLSPGNSGGPVYVFKEGKPYLVGISNRYFPGNNEIYGIVRPEKIKNFLHPKIQPENPLQNYVPFRKY